MYLGVIECILYQHVLFHENIASNIDDIIAKWDIDFFLPVIV